MTVNFSLCTFFIRQKPLFRETLCYLRDTMPRQCHVVFLVLPMLLVWYYITQWSSGTAPVLLKGRYATPVVTWWSTSSATDLREHFLLSGVFYFALLPAFFKASLGASSSTTTLGALHADLQNITPAQLLVWIPAIHKRFICGRFYLRARAGQSQNIKLYRELVLQNISFEILASYGIWTIFTISDHFTSLLS